MKPTLPDGEFISLYESIGPTEISRMTGVTLRNVQNRRVKLEKKYKRPIRVPYSHLARSIRPKEYPWQVNLEIQNGHAIVASDCHYWPGEPSLMHRAVVAACKEYRPSVVVLNGDVLDFSQIGRHPGIMWENKPELSDEIEAAKEKVHEIASATFKARKLWMLGNHDQRFESTLANRCPEYAKIHGVHLKDHFPLWECGWTSIINNEVYVTHRWKSGEYAPKNNAKMSGKTTVTGHLHSAQVIPHTDLNGTRYGVDTGCVADTDHRAFSEYTEGKAVISWRSAFCILTFKDGQLMYPELVTKWDESRVQFRGEVFAP